MYKIRSVRRGLCRCLCPRRLGLLLFVVVVVACELFRIPHRKRERDGAVRLPKWEDQFVVVL